jgi:hypothetical protein
MTVFDLLRFDNREGEETKDKAEPEGESGWEMGVEGDVAASRIKRREST